MKKLTVAYSHTPDEMRSVGSQLTTIQGAIGDQITAARTAVDGLIGAGFATQMASGAYADQFGQLATGLQQVSENLGPLGEFLTQYANTVEQVDTEFGSAISG